MKITIIAMPGSGNLGDDLISEYLVQHIHKSYPESRIGILCGDESLEEFHKSIKDKIDYLQKPRKRSYSHYFKRHHKIKIYIKESNIIFVGGGGLFQDSHSIFTIHNYLRYLAHAHAPIVFVGIGVGPIKFSLNKYLIRKFLNHDGVFIQVRDLESKLLLEKIGVENEIQLSNDIVEGSNISNLINNIPKTTDLSLGCNIRNWPDVDIDLFVEYLTNLIQVKGYKIVLFFVFEYTNENWGEKIFDNIIMNKLKNKVDCKIDLFVYNENSNYEFFRNFFSVHEAISSRYHGNILWQKGHTPTIPVAYSPKIKSLFPNYNVYEFNDLCLQKEFKFLKIEKNLLHSYNLPYFSVSNLNYETNIKILMTILNTIEFVYSVIRSFIIRTVR